MAQGQIGSGLLQVGISGVEPRQASGLAQDISNLFGSVAKGVETYNTIGETAAKLEYSTKALEASDKITEQRILLNKYEANNDTNGIIEVQNNIHSITQELNTKASDFSNHKAAYDVYNNLSLDFASKVRATYDPITSSAFIKANKANRTAQLDKSIQKKAMAGIPVSTIELYSEQDVNKQSLFSDIEMDKFRTDVFSSNFHGINAVLDKDPAGVMSQFKLVKLDDKAGKIYDLNSERKMIDTLFGDLYTTDKEGRIIATSANKEPDQKEIDTLASALGSFRGKLMKQDGSIYNANFAAKLSDVNANLASLESGDISWDSIAQTSAYKFISTAPIYTLSEGQQHEQQVVALKINDAMQASVAIDGYLLGVMSANNFRELDRAKTEGVELTTQNGSSIAVSASRINKAATNAVERIDAKSMDAFRNGRMDELLTNLNQYNTGVRNLTGKELKVVEYSKGVIGGGTAGMVGTQDYKNSLNVMLTLASNGQGVAPTSAGSRQVQAYRETLIQIADIEQRYAKDPQGLKVAINQLRSAGINDVNNNFNINATGFASLGSGSMDKWHRMGTTAAFTLQEANGLGYYAATKGYRITTKDEADTFIKENYTRTNMEWFGGQASYRPNNVSDNQADAMVRTLANRANVKHNQTGYRVRFLNGSDKVNEWISADLLDVNGRVVKSLIFDLAKLNALAETDTTTRNQTETQSTLPPLPPVIGKGKDSQLRPPPPLVFPKQYKKKDK